MRTKEYRDYQEMKLSYRGLVKANTDLIDQVKNLQKENDFLKNKIEKISLHLENDRIYKKIILEIINEREFD